jgi:hypothetical protein
LDEIASVNTTTASVQPNRSANEYPTSADAGVNKILAFAAPRSESRTEKKTEQRYVAPPKAKKPVSSEIQAPLVPNGSNHRADVDVNVINDRYKIEITTEDLSVAPLEASGHDPSHEDEEEELEIQSMRSLWSRRYARTLEEGIRRETASELNSLLSDAQIEARTTEGRLYMERTFMGLVNAVADEHEDLDIDISTVADSPFWRKEVKELRINFSRLGFKPIPLGGYEIQEDDRQLFLIESADEAFDRIDKDNS